MSTKIQLTIKRMEDPILNGKIDGYGDLIRVFGLIKLKEKDGAWSKSYPAIIDTGAPISVIPLSRWIQSDVEILTDHEMRGIVEKPECSTHVSVGRLNIVLCDEYGNISKEREIFAYFALTDKIPIIIGFKNVLEQMTLHVNAVEGFVLDDAIG